MGDRRVGLRLRLSHAYDASRTGTLTSAWTTLDPRTRRSFWEGACVRDDPPGFEHVK